MPAPAPRSTTTAPGVTTRETARRTAATRTTAARYWQCSASIRNTRTGFPTRHQPHRERGAPPLRLPQIRAGCSARERSEADRRAHPELLVRHGTCAVLRQLGHAPILDQAWGRIGLLRPGPTRGRCTVVLVAGDVRVPRLGHGALPLDSHRRDAIAYQAERIRIARPPRENGPRPERHSADYSPWVAMVAHLGSPVV
jgi:hypothetical protein